jgi:molecular chaperone Hsp33
VGRLSSLAGRVSSLASSLRATPFIDSATQAVSGRVSSLASSLRATPFMTDVLRRSLTADSRILDADVTEVAAETIRRHGLTGRAAKLATEGIVASVLLSAHIKGEERMLVQVQGEVPRFAFTAEVWSNGAVRARLTPSVVGNAPIRGTLVAIKHDETKELYRGAARIDGSFAKALQQYLTQSQQTRGTVEITGATGRLEEQLPPGPELQPFVDEPLALRFQCTCSIERVEGTLRALGSEDLRALAEEEGQGEVTCHFCNEQYVVPGDRLLELAKG